MKRLSIWRRFSFLRIKGVTDSCIRLTVLLLAVQGGERGTGVETALPTLTVAEETGCTAGREETRAWRGKAGRGWEVGARWGRILLERHGGPQTRQAGMVAWLQGQKRCCAHGHPPRATVLGHRDHAPRAMVSGPWATSHRLSVCLLSAHPLHPVPFQFGQLDMALWQVSPPVVFMVGDPVAWC